MINAVREKEGKIVQIPWNEKCEITQKGGRSRRKTNKNDANTNNMFYIKIKLSYRFVCVVGRRFINAITDKHVILKSINLRENDLVEKLLIDKISERPKT